MAAFGEDFDVLRWTTGARDENEHVIWHNRYPDNNEWQHVRMATVDLTPNEDYRTPRNIPVSPDQPLDPYGSDKPDAYTIEDAVQFAIDFDIMTP